jgi:hypothetical protein
MKNIPTPTIAFSYPGFQALPAGVKRMLVVSESFFFDQKDAAVSPKKVSGRENRIGQNMKPFSGPEWLNTRITHLS